MSLQVSERWNLTPTGFAWLLFFQRKQPAAVNAERLQLPPAPSHRLDFSKWVSVLVWQMFWRGLFPRTSSLAPPPPALSPPRPKAEDSTRSHRVAFEPQVNSRAALAAELPPLPALRRRPVRSPSPPALPGERSPRARPLPSEGARKPSCLPFGCYFSLLPSPPPFCCHCCGFGARFHVILFSFFMDSTCTLSSSELASVFR